MLSKYINANTHVRVKCKKDGYEWNVKPNNLLSYKTGCPKCKESVGEKTIAKYLIKYDINFILQKTFEQCKFKKLLPFDFYLPEDNICIEFQGPQHYEPVDFGGKGEEWAKKQFILNQKRDNIKKVFCKKNSIKLIEIPYWLEDIDEYLTKEIFVDR